MRPNQKSECLQTQIICKKWPLTNVRRDEINVCFTFYHVLKGFVRFCKVFLILCNFWGGPTDRPTDQEADRRTDLGIKAPRWNLKNFKKFFGQGKN